MKDDIRLALITALGLFAMWCVRDCGVPMRRAYGAQCVATGNRCSADADCCSGTCSGHKCIVLPDPETK